MKQRPARASNFQAQVATGRPNIHKSIDSKNKRKNSQPSKDGLFGTSPESIYTQVQLKPEAKNVGSKSRSREPNPATVNRIPQGTTLSAGKISRQPHTQATSTHEALQNQQQPSAKLNQSVNNSSGGLNFHQMNQEYQI